MRVLARSTLIVLVLVGCVSCDQVSKMTARQYVFQFLVDRGCILRYANLIQQQPRIIRRLLFMTSHGHI